MSEFLFAQKGLDYRVISVPVHASGLICIQRELCSGVCKAQLPGSLFCHAYLFNPCSSLQKEVRYPHLKDEEMKQERQTDGLPRSLCTSGI